MTDLVRVIAVRLVRSEACQTVLYIVAAKIITKQLKIIQKEEHSPVK